MTRHIGAFIQNTLKPLIEELDKILEDCKTLKFTKEEIEKIIERFVWLEFKITFLYLIGFIILGAIGCFIVYWILK
jgi:hypothetical protein